MMKKDYLFYRFYKMVSEDGKTFVIIPGVIKSKDGIESSFIQFVDEKTGKSGYIQYGSDEYYISHDKKAMKVGSSLFYENAISLKIIENDISIEGRIEFRDGVPINKKRPIQSFLELLSYIPFFECRHNIISIRNTLLGSLTVDGEERVFDDGYGYIEGAGKYTFPKKKLWIQSGFGNNASVMFAASILFTNAALPFGEISLPCFISCVEINRRTHVFASYTGAHFRINKYCGNGVFIMIEDDKYRMEITYCNGESYTLRAPMEGQMQAAEKFRTGARVEINVMDKKGNSIYRGLSNDGSGETIG